MRLRLINLRFLIGVCILLLTACQTLPQPKVSQIPDIKTKSITGAVVDRSVNTVTVAYQQSNYNFTINKAAFKGTQKFALGDTLTVYYQDNDPTTAVEIQLVKSATSRAEDQIYDVLGTAASITGEKWDKMQAHRKQLTQIAKNHRDSVYVNMDPSQQVVYLTFDDGPDPVNTLAVMKTLVEQDVGATFFLTGENIQKNPSLVKELYDNGFTIGLHGYDHRSLDSLSGGEIADQLNRTNALIVEITGQGSKIMRPPYGALTEDTIATIKELKYQIYLWSLDTLDWAQSDKAEILRNVKENLRPGDIILMHATYDQSLTSEILPEVISYIKNQGYELAALPQ